MTDKNFVAIVTAVSRFMEAMHAERRRLLSLCEESALDSLAHPDPEEHISVLEGGIMDVNYMMLKAFFSFRREFTKVVESADVAKVLRPLATRAIGCMEAEDQISARADLDLEVGNLTRTPPLGGDPIDIFTEGGESWV